jgi:excisionase family DNA binding protein
MEIDLALSKELSDAFNPLAAGAVIRHEGRTPKSSSFLDASSVAEFLGVSRRWVMARTRAGEIPALRFGKVFRYKMSAIEAWLEGQNAKR